VPIAPGRTFILTEAADDIGCRQSVRTLILKKALNVSQQADANAFVLAGLRRGQRQGGSPRQHRPPVTTLVRNRQ
jgi:hypothetical protein